MVKIAMAKNMIDVLLSIGSNIHRKHHIASGIAALRQLDADLEISEVYESEAVGFDGDNFYNLVALIKTDASVAELAGQLRDIENRHGRDRKAPKFSARTLDIDILTYGQHTGVIDGVRLPRSEVFKNAFVLLPLAERFPEMVCPGEDLSYAQLWQILNLHHQKLWVVDASFIDSD